MTGNHHLLSFASIASCCVLAFLGGCAESSPTNTLVSRPQHTDVAPAGAITSRSKIYLTVKEGTQTKQIQDFVEYLGCRVIENVPQGGNLYIVEVPPTLSAQKVIPKFTAHPWVVNASLKEEKKF